MRKQLGLLTTLIVLCASAFSWAGSRYNNNGYYSYDSGYEYQAGEVVNYVPANAPQPYPGPAQCKPVCKPCPPPCEQCPRPATHGSTSSEICCDGVMVTASQPKLCILGDNYALDVTVRACVDVCHVDVNAILPEGVTLVRSEPAGVTTSNNGQLSWSLDAMKKGEVKTSRVILHADREGDLCVCFCVTAVPVQFCTILCAKPQLECSKCGPEEVCPGDPIHYTITVTNRGSVQLKK